MKNHPKFKIIIVAALVVVVLGAISLSWLYTGKITSTKAKIYDYTLLPAAFVNGEVVTLSSFVQRYKLLNLVSGQSAQSDSKKVIFDKLIADSEIQQIASGKGIRVQDKDLTALYNQMAAELSGGDEKKLESMIVNYSGLSKKEFQKTVLHSILLERGLKTWYYGQRELNKPLYAQADLILDSAKNGEDFAVLATKYSTDEATAVFAGDSGYLPVSSLAPEVKEGLKGLKNDDIKVLPGSDGLHILKLIARDNGGDSGEERVHLLHIFVQGRGYEEWLRNTQKRFKVIDLTGRLKL